MSNEFDSHCVGEIKTRVIHINMNQMLQETLCGNNSSQVIVNRYTFVIEISPGVSP
jgi:hypothetical protein